MRPFAHVDARTVEEACGLLAEFGGRARVNAGGTDLVGVLKDGIHAEPIEALINIKNIPGLDYIRVDDDQICIGPLASLSAIARSKALLSSCVILAEAARAVGTPQLRNMGTLGGNLCQEVRCWYYRYPSHVGGPIACLRKGNGTCPATRGDNRYHAIIGGRGCFAVCPSDMAVALAAVDATVSLVGPGGSCRWIPVEDLYTPLGITIAPGEMITEVRVPAPVEEATSGFFKFTVREPVDFAIVSLGATVGVRDGVCEESRIVLGAVGPRPYRAAAAETFLRGRWLDAESAAMAADLAVADAKPLRMNTYKVEIARTLVKRALVELAARP
jgi:xanthine dehydrogenase YagS FAD-binding subunit